ncbi:butyrophilin subfamily 3 member A2-like [Alligator mississippiensis]|uniref:butyrophilin subfamily 3 member A2-like n=1 Tax=Alligator mississippiensis TaxID=8496 RepID=UPI002877A816|nr:butyrophilin subfamily 3 member A2-like [Alligator mississippiensis]
MNTRTVRGAFPEASGPGPPVWRWGSPRRAGPAGEQPWEGARSSAPAPRGRHGPAAVAQHSAGHTAMKREVSLFCFSPSASPSLPGCIALLIALQVHRLVAAQFRVIGPDQPVVASVGAVAVLPCRLSPATSAESMEVRWFRSRFSSVVHLYRGGRDQPGEQMQEYLGRTQLLKHNITSGSISLRIRGVRLSDCGQYTCFVQSHVSYEEALLELQVTALGSDPHVSAEGHQDGGIRMVCRSAGWHPEPEVQWRDHRGQPLPPASEKVFTDTAGLFHTEVSVVIMAESNQNVTCAVRSLFLNQEKTATISIAGTLQSKLESEKEALRSELETEKGLLQSKLESEKAALKSALESEKERRRADKAEYEAMKRTLQSKLENEKRLLQSKLEREKEALKSALESEKERRRADKGTLQSKLENEKRLLQSKLEREKAALKSALESEKERRRADKAEYEAMKRTLQSELENEKRLLQSRLEREKAALKSALESEKVKYKAVEGLTKAQRHAGRRCIPSRDRPTSPGTQRIPCGCGDCLPWP